MARTRMIKADFFRSRSLAKVSRDARLTFIGLWTEADALGRGVAHPSIIKGSVWPLDDDITTDVVAAHLAELAETSHIVLYYDDAGDALYEIANWAKHQSAAYRTGESKHPAPDLARKVVQVARQTVQVAGEVVQVARPTVQVAAETVHKEKGREGKRKEIAPTSSTRAPNSLWDALSALFGEPVTSSEKSNRGRHVREIAQAGGTAYDIHARAAEHARRKLHWTLTANSLVTHWTELAPTAPTEPKIDSHTGAHLSPFLRA